MSDHQVLRDYYEARAPWYDNAYQQPAPPWVGRMVADLDDALRTRTVLEIACGTGHWTREAARVAGSVTGVDSSPTMRAIARTKLVDGSPVTLVDADAYTLDGVPGGFTGGLAMQWISHVPVTRLASFFAAFHGRLAPGAVVFLADNMPAGGWGERLLRRPGSADTYEEREVPGRTPYVIVKNYFTEGQLRAMVAPFGTDLRVVLDERWWWLSYRLTPLDERRPEGTQ